MVWLPPKKTDYGLYPPYNKGPPLDGFDTSTQLWLTLLFCCWSFYFCEMSLLRFYLLLLIPSYLVVVNRFRLYCILHYTFFSPSKSFGTLFWPLWYVVLQKGSGDLQGPTFAPKVEKTLDRQVRCFSDSCTTDELEYKICFESNLTRFFQAPTPV